VFLQKSRNELVNDLKNDLKNDLGLLLGGGAARGKTEQVRKVLVSRTRREHIKDQWPESEVRLKCAPRN